MKRLLLCAVILTAVAACAQSSGGNRGGTGAVTSAFGRTGAVVAVTNDYTAAQITNAVDLTSVQVLTNKDLTGAGNIFPTSLVTLTGSQALTNKDLTGVGNKFPTTAGGSYASGTTTTSIPAATLCSTTNCPAGSYLVMVYVNEVGTGCTTVGAGLVKTQVNFIDNQAQTRSAVVVAGVQTTTGNPGPNMAFSTTGLNYFSGSYLVNTNGSAVSGSDAIQVLSAVTTCGTAGPWTGYQVRAYTLKVG